MPMTLQEIADSLTKLLGEKDVAGSDGGIYAVGSEESETIDLGEIDIIDVSGAVIGQTSEKTGMSKTDLDVLLSDLTGDYSMKPNYKPYIPPDPAEEYPTDWGSF